MKPLKATTLQHCALAMIELAFDSVREAKTQNRLSTQQRLREHGTVVLRGPRGEGHSYVDVLLRRKGHNVFCFDAFQFKGFSVSQVDSALRDFRRDLRTYVSAVTPKAPDESEEEMPRPEIVLVVDNAMYLERAHMRDISELSASDVDVIAFLG